MSKKLIYMKPDIIPAKFENIIGESRAIKDIYGQISEMAKFDTTVLLIGESGTGKELIARAIHYSGIKKDRPLVAVDCASIPGNLLESELFGYEKGAFTDAKFQKPGKFEMADGGTLFFDEIGNMPVDMQSKILRVIETKEFQRLGSVRNIKINARIISATNIDLKKAVEKGDFRQDLYYRINVVPISVPPLRERDGDIELLVRHYLNIFNKKFKKNIKAVAKDAMKTLVSYDWPGNVRELRNVVERVVALSKGRTILPKMLPANISYKADKAGPLPGPSGKEALKPARHRFEKQFIADVMEKCNWNQSRAAKILNIHRNTLILKMKAFGLKSYCRLKQPPEAES